MITTFYIFFVLTTIVYGSSVMRQGNENWFYKFSFTKNINSQLSIDCENNDQIWIGWSHYGTRNAMMKSSGIMNEPVATSTQFSSTFPNENDCWMNFTEKIAEQCNGAEHCELSSQPTYIHKCGKISDYLYVTYKCIRERDTFDICKATSRLFSQEKMQNEQQSFYIKSSDFPTEYSSSLDCSCLISSTSSQQTLKIETLWFSLQDNDYLNIFNKNLTGWINPTHEMPFVTNTKNNNVMIRFSTDDALAYKGFWLKIASRKACKDDWQLVGDNCVKVFSDALDWRSANQKCQLMNGQLLKIDDVVSDLKLTQYMKLHYAEISSYWIGLRKYLDQHNKEKWMWSSNSTLYSDVSWWPWRKVQSTAATSSTTSHDNDDDVLDVKSINNCVIKRRNEDGYFTTSCDPSNKNSFICQTNAVNTSPKSSSSPTNDLIKLQCGLTSEVQAELRELEAKVKVTNEIKSNSIKNVVLPFASQSTTQAPHLISQTKTNKMRSSTFSKSPLTTSSLFHKTKISGHVMMLNNDQTSSVIIKPASQSNDDGIVGDNTKINTTVLAGIIAGIGLVIVIINLAVLFICRRNLKKFLKSSKDQSSSSTGTTTRTPKEDMIQEYFEAFNTLHSNVKTLKGGLCVIPSMLPQQQLQGRTNSLSSGDDSLLHESAQLFYNPSQQQQQNQFSRDLIVRQSQSQQSSASSSSAFKPFSNNSTSQLIDLQRQQFSPNSQNQYDKMNHHNLLLNANHSMNKSSLLTNNESTDQYAHTYECLDTLEMPNRRAFVHLGVNSRNYRTVFNKNDLNAIQQSTTYEFLPSSANLTLNENNSNNLSSSSASSSSGTSSTHQILKQSPNNQQQQLIDNQFILKQLQSNMNRGGNAATAQLVSLNDLKQLNHIILQNSQNQGIDAATASAVLCNLVNGDLVINGSWSPDSAYYSSIPTLANYNSFNINSNQSQMFLNNNGSTNNENFKSHIV